MAFSESPHWALAAVLNAITSTDKRATLTPVLPQIDLKILIVCLFNLVILLLE
jgi:hypothetical protein